MPLGTCILWQPQWECLDPDEGPMTWRTPEQREELRETLRARLRWYTAPRAPSLGE